MTRRTGARPPTSGQNPAPTAPGRRAAADSCRPPAPQRLPQAGAINVATQWTFADLAPGTYSWSVRAVDSAFAGSSAATATFTIPLDADLLFADGFEP